ncbi:MAG: hypothetical protein HQK54_09920 [Oligoflexales bacterium]|nr:hypothetical protein [Oligoflexales bacterium]
MKTENASISTERLSQNLDNSNQSQPNHGSGVAMKVLHTKFLCHYWIITVFCLSIFNLETSLKAESDYEDNQQQENPKEIILSGPVSAWIKTIARENVDGRESFPHKIIIVQKFDKNSGNPEFREIDHTKFNGIGFLKLISQAEINLHISINQKPDEILSQAEKDDAKKLKSEGIKYWVPLLMKSTHADTLIYAPKEHDVPWQIYRMETTGPKMALEAQPPDKSPGKDPTVYITWLAKTLGYDAFVLGENIDQMLIGYISPLPQKANSQALVLRNSAAHLHFPPSKHKGNGLLQLDSIPYPGTALYKIILSGKEKGGMARGLKVIFEKN